MYAYVNMYICEYVCKYYVCAYVYINTVKPVLNGLSRDQKFFPLKAVSA